MRKGNITLNNKEYCFVRKEGTVLTLNNKGDIALTLNNKGIILYKGLTYKKVLLCTKRGITVNNRGYHFL